MANWVRLAQDTTTESHIFVPISTIDKFSIFKISETSYEIRATRENYPHVVAANLPTKEAAAALLQTVIQGINLLDV